MAGAEPGAIARGAAAEAAVQSHLLAAGLTPLARNVRYRFGELDLVLRDGACVVFVEVRYRRGGRFGGGAVSVDAGKRRRLVRAAQAYLAARPALGRQPCRFDVVAVSGSTDAPEFDWIRNAFTLDDI